MKARELNERERQEIVARVKDRLHPRKLILFGSYARGDYHAGSDIDLCIIVNEAGDWFERILEFKRLVELEDREIEPHIYTDAEFQRLLDSGNPLVEQVVREGIVLYEQQ